MWSGKASTSGTFRTWPLRAAGAADAARKRDDKAAVPALIGADLQQLRRDHAVKAGPVGQGVAVVNLADHRRHQGDGVGLAMGEGEDVAGGAVVIHQYPNAQPSLRGSEAPVSPPSCPIRMA
jgi:hypothetical protein